jgi:predicted permease
MTRALFALPALLFASSAFAEAAEAPTEKASPFAVMVFLVLFFGAIVAYFVYLWWNQRKAGPEDTAQPTKD